MLSHVFWWFGQIDRDLGGVFLWVEETFADVADLGTFWEMLFSSVGQLFCLFFFVRRLCQVSVGTLYGCLMDFLVFCYFGYF